MEAECVVLGGDQDGVRARTGLVRIRGKGHGLRRSRFGLHAFQGGSCSHSGQRWEQVPIQTQSEGDPCQAPRGGVGDKKRGEWWPSWRVLASKILGLVLWKEKGHSMIFSREVASSK